MRLTILLALLVSIPAQAATVLFQDGFEGTLSGWNVNGGDPTPANTQSTAVVHSGSKSLKYSTFAHDGHANGGMLRNISVPSQKNYVSFWFYPTTQLQPFGGSHFWRWYGQSSPSCGPICQYDTQARDPSGVEFVVYWPGEGVNNDYDTRPKINNIPLNQWTHIEQYIDLGGVNAFNAVEKVWVNGVLKVNLSGRNLRTQANLIDRFNLNTNFDAPITTLWYFDDFVMCDDQPTTGDACALAAGNSGPPPPPSVIPNAPTIHLP